MPSSTFTIEHSSHISNISEAEWNRLNPDGHVFCQHGFLTAFEKADCLTPNGWSGHHLLVYQQILETSENPTDKILVAALILYQKDNSMGEFIFDFAWAEAYERYQMPYYPKLLSAIPFTPASGKRFLCAPDIDFKTVWPLITDHLADICGSGEDPNSGFSSHHINFCSADFVEQQQGLSTVNYLQRQDCQYHWYNKNFGNFDGFLASLSSKRRKNIRRERRLAQSLGYQIQFFTGDTLPEAYWQSIYYCYAVTFLKRMREPPLNQALFKAWAQGLQQKMVFITAIDDTKNSNEQVIACAICFRDQHRLYGRYWGALQAIEHLHFEICYYQGIEYCLEEGLQAFEPGAQGEHKIWRGFDPTITYSLHYINHPGMSAAIDDFLQNEIEWNDERHLQLSNHSAYKKETI
jgi:hypothetical protein